MANEGIDLSIAVENGKPSVLEFYSRECPHCVQTAKSLYSVEHKHVNDINWVMIDTQDSTYQLLWQSLGVHEIPHFAFLDKDENLKATAIGVIDVATAEHGIALASSSS
uniref:Thioredoxin domain-containing protein n=1 Tax=Aureoumbra lagunensis TaxID=44058 RepID=A0A7S3JQD9_9STRA